MRVARLGSEHAFSGQAARAYFGKEAEYQSAGSFPELLQLVESSAADAAVLPVENVLAGAVDEVLDLIASTEQTIVGERFHPVELCLAGKGEPEQLERIVSHPKALEQCRAWLPEVERKKASDTARAAELVAANPRWAAITSPQAAEAHGLKILERAVADRPGNGTRFLILQRKPVSVEGSDTCSLIAILPHRVGALAETLSCLANAGMNLTRIESRPIHGPRLPPPLSAMPRRSGSGFVRFSSRIVHRLFVSSQRPNHHPLPRILPEQIR